MNVRSASARGDFDTDFLVVGSGFGGAVAALRLVEKGYRVLVLEKGRRWSPSDFPESNWNLPKAFWMPWIGFHGTWAMHLLREVLVLHGVGVGGGSLLYANTHLEPEASVWDDPQWKGLHDWRDVMPAHYETARRMLGSVPCPRLGPGDEALKKIAERRGAGAHFYPTRVGVFFGEPGVEVEDPYFEGAGPRRTGCTFCGGCMVGCRVGAKNTLDRNYLYLAEAGGARILPERKVDLLVPLEGGGYAVHWRSSTSWLVPEKGVVRAREVVIAGGVLGSVPLLLDCKRVGTLPRLSDRLGAVVRTNSEALLGITSRSRDDLWQGVAIQAEVRVDERTRMELVRFQEGSDVMLLLGTLLTDGGGSVPRALRWLGRMAGHPLQALRVTKPWGKARTSQVLLVMQTVESQTALEKRRRAYWPFIRTISSCRPPGEIPIPAYIPVGNEVAREVAAELDAIPQSSINEVLLDQSTTAHILGGCAMGGSPDEGVVDPWCRVFGHEGLYVLDGSVIGANLGANPSLTITALAELATSHIPPAGA